MPEPCLFAGDITNHLGVAKNTVYMCIAEKRTLAHKVGRMWKFQPAEVDDWVCREAEQDDDPARV
jgi:excisionase family DNA binding protein